MISRSYSSNLTLHFWLNLTTRRNFIPILALYYLSLPGTSAADIGIYMAAGYGASLLCQVPAGIFADRYGGHRALIISKVFLLLSSLCYLTDFGFLAFICGSVCMSIGFSFWDGVSAAFLKGTLEALGQGDEYRRISSRLSGNVSLLSVLLILALPFLTIIDISAPLWVALGIDIIGLIIVFGLHPLPTRHHETESMKNPLALIREVRGGGFLAFALFAGVIGGFLGADNAYRGPYLTELGYPLALIGVTMALSRVVWWAVSRYIHEIEQYLSIARLILIEILVFPLSYLAVGYIENPWIVGLIFSLVVGWFWGRNEIYTDLLIHRIHDPRYRSTLLSVKSWITSLSQILVSLGIAGVMGYSYSLGFQILALTLFVSLILIYWFGLRRILSEKELISLDFL